MAKRKQDKKQMIINYVPGEECRVALVENGTLEEYHDERTNAVTVVGNVYVGKVTNVEASIQAAFIDFGQGANGFLHVSDLHPQYFPGEDEETKELIGKKTPRRDRPPIQKCLKRGQRVIVQVIKEGISTKGPTLTTYLSIPGRYIVMLPQMDRVGVSRKVEDEDARRQMRKVLDGIELPGDFGFIVRTAGLGKSKADLKRDLAYLQRLWKDIETRRDNGSGPRLLYAESDLLMRALRDYWTSDIEEIVIDHESALRRAGRFMKIVSPRSSTRLLNYNRDTPLFHAFGLEEQIRRTHERTVPLPSGGSLVIDETEALVAIDVNSGKMRHHGDAETTAYKTNVEAVDEICRQLRLRDIGGLIVCDLIDMSRRSNRRDIEQQFRDRLKRDRAATKPLPISQFGIVEMTRQRMRGSLKSMHYTKCPTCEGKGVLRRPGSLSSDTLRELASLLQQPKVHKVEMAVSPRLSGELLSNRRTSLTRLEYQTSKKVVVRVSEDISIDRVSFYAYDENGADIAVDRLAKLAPPSDLKEWIDEQSKETDWAVDTLAEHAAIKPAPIPEPVIDDPFSMLEESNEREGSEPPKKKRRRSRRSKRGRKKSSDQASEVGAEAGSEAGAPAEVETDAESKPEETTEPRKPGRRRRRGGRGRRGRGRGESTSSETSADSETPTAEAGDTEVKPVKVVKPAANKVTVVQVNRVETSESKDRSKKSEEGDKSDKSGSSLRGDSWDVAPSELAATNGAASPPSKPEVKPKKSSAKKETEEAATPPAKKRPSRRSKKKTTAKAGDADVAEKADPPAKPAAKTASKAASKAKSKAKPKSKAAEPEPKSESEDSGSDATSKKVRKRSSRKKTTKKTPASKATSTKAAADKSAEAKPAVKKPARSLYGSQRKKTSSRAAASRSDRDE